MCVWCVCMGVCVCVWVCVMVCLFLGIMFDSNPWPTHAQLHTFFWSLNKQMMNQNEGLSIGTTKRHALPAFTSVFQPEYKKSLMESFKNIWLNMILISWRVPFKQLWKSWQPPFSPARDSVWIWSRIHRTFGPKKLIVKGTKGLCQSKSCYQMQKQTSLHRNK